VEDWQDWPTPVAHHAAPDDRAWVAGVAALVPHVLILAEMAIGIARAEGVERGYAALIGFAELYVVPAALVVALCLRWSSRLRARARPVAVATAAGAIVVVLATLIVGNGATWS
jgi:hypothetical protein